MKRHRTRALVVCRSADGAKRRHSWERRILCASGPRRLREPPLRSPPLLTWAFFGRSNWNQVFAEILLSGYSTWLGLGRSVAWGKKMEVRCVDATRVRDARGEVVVLKIVTSRDGERAARAHAKLAEAWGREKKSCNSRRHVRAALHRRLLVAVRAALHSSGACSSALHHFVSNWSVALCANKNKHKRSALPRLRRAAATGLGQRGDVTHTARRRLSRGSIARETRRRSLGRRARRYGARVSFLAQHSLKKRGNHDTKRARRPSAKSGGRALGEYLERCRACGDRGSGRARGLEKKRLGNETLVCFGET